MARIRFCPSASLSVFFDFSLAFGSETVCFVVFRFGKIENRGDMAGIRKTKDTGFEILKLKWYHPAHEFETFQSIRLRPGQQ